MRKVPTRQAALTLVEEGHSYAEAGLRLGVPPGVLPSAQGLVNPRTEQPDPAATIEPQRARAARSA